ncbi:hypothetical protein Pelo_12082 [Pelomyxa schiedti]|nr:hypothetical protein Pelo_12082 [Pelomyxa schiedti]
MSKCSSNLVTLQSYAKSCCWSPDGSFFVLSTFKGPQDESSVLDVHRASDLSKLWTIPCTQMICSLSVSRRPTVIAGGCKDLLVRLWVWHPDPAHNHTQSSLSETSTSSSCSSHNAFITSLARCCCCLCCDGSWIEISAVRCGGIVAGCGLNSAATKLASFCWGGELTVWSISGTFCPTATTCGSSLRSRLWDPPGVSDSQHQQCEEEHYVGVTRNREKCCRLKITAAAQTHILFGDGSHHCTFSPDETYIIAGTTILHTKTLLEATWSKPLKAVVSSWSLQNPVGPIGSVYGVAWGSDPKACAVVGTHGAALASNLSELPVEVTAPSSAPVNTVHRHRHSHSIGISSTPLPAVSVASAKSMHISGAATIVLSIRDNYGVVVATCRYRTLMVVQALPKPGCASLSTSLSSASTYGILAARDLFSIESDNNPFQRRLHFMSLSPPNKQTLHQWAPGMTLICCFSYANKVVVIQNITVHSHPPFLQVKPLLVGWKKDSQCSLFQTNVSLIVLQQIIELAWGVVLPKPLRL